MSGDQQQGLLTKEESTRISKLLSYVLRHNPEYIGIHPDENGWVGVESLINQLAEHNEKIDFQRLKYLVDTNPKKRFSFNEDQTLIRASQGHSIEIALNYSPRTPPEILFHGTADWKIAAIKLNGLLKMDRHHVHLSADEGVAKEVGRRHGNPVVLTIQAMAMYKQGHLFYLSDNGVWLTDHVPAVFIVMP